MTWLGSGSRAGSHCRERMRGELQKKSHKETTKKRQLKSVCEEMATVKEGAETDGYIGVFVENDLKEVGREYRWSFEMLLGSEDVLLLPVWTWRGAGQICKHTKVKDYTSD